MCVIGDMLLYLNAMMWLLVNAPEHSSKMLPVQSELSFCPGLYHTLQWLHAFIVWLPCERGSCIKSLPQSQEFSGLKRSKGGIPDVEKSAFH